MENKLVTAIMAATIALATVGLQSSYAQYGTGNPTGTATQGQLEECEKYGIDRTECNEHTLLAKRKVIEALNNPKSGSGTALLSISGEQTWVFVGILGVVFGGVAAAFFVRGRKAAA